MAAYMSDSVLHSEGATVGLMETVGCFTRYGMTLPLSLGGFQMYAPDHWALLGKSLRYGDSFDTDTINIAVFEVRKVQFFFKKGLPYPATHDSGSHKFTNYYDVRGNHRRTRYLWRARVY
ncbi:hypothetical protein BDV33DRAFT_203656 [Aspergillus novoparasiticus]|uniref:Uncharacterized protein n=1 Tax=Aspergillus novoparasiticus TaxID=986946 RepID=A0A5N6ERI7_9EURO|nr:hypothetical protein BDV33DRAFT_203656 [Aspergillus novoparasiticus]